MININELTPKDVGRWVIRTGSDGELEWGKLKSWNDTSIFVVYNANGFWWEGQWEDYTGESTRPEDLEFQEDESYGDAVMIVRESRTVSPALLQRKLRIGYARAAQMIDMMERRGVVGPQDGIRPRKVL